MSPYTKKLHDTYGFVPVQQAGRSCGTALAIAVAEKRNIAMTEN